MSLKLYLISGSFCANGHTSESDYFMIEILINIILPQRRSQQKSSQLSWQLLIEEYLTPLLFVRRLTFELRGFN